MVVLILAVLVPLAIAAIICGDVLVERKAKIAALEKSLQACIEAFGLSVKRCEELQEVKKLLTSQLVDEQIALVQTGSELARLTDDHKQITEELAQLKASIATEAARKRPLWRALADRIANGDTE